MSHPPTLVTHDGQVHTGLPIYESPDSTLLQTTADVTLRITGETVAARYPSGSSLMPAGLLDDLSDGDLADLYVYLSREF
jgi:hypothetical protein